MEKKTIGITMGIVGLVLVYLSLTGILYQFNNINNNLINLSGITPAGGIGIEVVATFTTLLPYLELIAGSILLSLSILILFFKK